MSQREVSSITESVAGLHRKVSDLENELVRRLNDHAGRHEPGGGDVVTNFGPLIFKNSFGDTAGVIEAFDTTGRDLLIISASTAADTLDGVRIQLYGPGDSSAPGDFFVYNAGGDSLLQYDASEDLWKLNKDVRISADLFTQKIQTGRTTFFVEPWNVATINLGVFGSIGTQGSFRTSLVWNFERDTSSGWTLLGVNGFTRAVAIELGNEGIIFRDESNWPAAGIPLTRMTLSEAGLSIFPKFADNALVLNLGIERAWFFRQRGTGSGTALDLESSSNKDFYIRSVTNGDIMRFIGGTASGSRIRIDRSLTNVGNVAILRIAQGAAGSLQVIGHSSSWIKDPITGKRLKMRVTDLQLESHSLEEYWRRDWFLDIDPIKYERVQEDAEEGVEITTWEHPQIELGFSLENLIKHTNLLTTDGSKVGNSPDEMALLAVTIDYVQFLEHRMRALESKFLTDSETPGA